MTQDGSAPDAAIPRPGARAVILDRSGRVLLIRSLWGDEVLWFTPGGALQPGESFEEAALRELREEVRLDVSLGPCVWLRRATWEWRERGTWYATTERFFLVRLDVDEPAVDLAVGADEMVTLAEARWWTLGDLRASGEPVSPRALVTLLGPLVRGEVPAEPVEVGL